MNGKSHVAYATKEAQGLRLVVDSHTCVFTKEYDPTRLVTNTAGKLARYLVDDGASLRRGMPYAEIEVMKMYMPLLTPEAGVIRLLKSEGAVLAPGDCIATMELDDPSCVKKSDVFMGKLPSSDSTNGNSTKSVHKMRKSLAVLKSVLQGYYTPDDLMQKALNDLFQLLLEPLLPVDEIKEALSSLAGRIPLDVFAKITDKIQTYKKSLVEKPPATHEFNVADVVEILDDHQKTLDTDRKCSDFEASVATLRSIATKYKHGFISGEEAVLTDLINEYFTVETVYANSPNIEDVVMALRQQNSSDLNKVFSIARSHKALESKNKLLLQLLAQMSRGSAVAP